MKFLSILIGLLVALIVVGVIVAYGAGYRIETEDDRTVYIVIPSQSPLPPKPTATKPASAPAPTKQATRSAPAPTKPAPTAVPAAPVQPKAGQTFSADGKYCFPLPRKALTEGWHHHHWSAKDPNPIDLAAPFGTPVYAYTNGTIHLAASANGGPYAFHLWGDDGRTYRYSHVRKNFVKEGQRVGVGDLLAEVGDEGNAKRNPPYPHLHFAGDTTPRRADVAFAKSNINMAEDFVKKFGSAYRWAIDN